MTNGTSQGLFVVVAIVIFGIFILTSYLLFRDNLKPTLTNIFTDGVEQANCSLAGSDESTPTCNPTFNNSFKLTGKVKLGIGKAPYTIIWTPDAPSIRTINLTEDDRYSSSIENNTVEISCIDISGVIVKQEFLDNGFGKDVTKKGYVSINGGEDIYLGSTAYSSSAWGIEKHLKLKIGQINTIKFTFENVYGGKTTFDFQVNIINE